MIELLLSYLAMAVLAIQIAESGLAFKIKRLFKLHIPNQDIKNIGRFNSWYRLLGQKMFWICSPIVLIMVVLASTHQLLQELINCPICTSYWLGVFIGFFFGLSLSFTLILAFLCTGFVMVLMRVNR